jgi:hypothetical protein
MNAPLDTLLSRTGNWAKGELTPVENYILFVALLKSTNLVTFDVPARPNRSVVTGNMERLIKAAAWIHFLRTKIYLPSYVVRDENATLSNIHLWLEALEDAKTDFHSNYWTIGARNKLEARQDALERMIKSPSRNQLRYASTLADWALTASGADVKLDKEMQDQWRAIFRLRGNDIALVSLDDIEDVLDYMTLNLDSYKGGIFANEVILHLRKLKVMKEKGDFFGIIDYDTLDYDPEDVLDNPFKILPRDSKAHQFIKTVAANAPTTLPRKEDYATSVEFLRATSAYRIAQRTKAQIIKQVNSVVQNVDAQPANELAATSEEDTKADDYLI